MELKGKTLLLMGGSAYASSIKKYAKEKEFRIVAVGNVADAPYHKIADKAYTVSTQNVESIVKIVRKEHCDGIFVGASEVNILPAMMVAEQTGAHYYTEANLWKRLSNKREFKDLLAAHGIGITQEYEISSADDFEKVEYPVIIKPVDGSGARGISVAHNLDELKAGYERACKVSWTNKAIIEKYITDMTDMFIHYTIIDGKSSLSCTFDRHLNDSQGGFTGMAVGYTYPSIYTAQYVDQIDKKMRQAFQDAGLQNGAINIQCFTDGRDFFFYEAGYRLGGEQMYFFTEQLTGINVLELIINQALTGRMADSVEELEKDNPFFEKPCLSYYIPLKPGVITVMDGVEEIQSIDGVLNITRFCAVGDTISGDGSLGQVCLRMHLMKDTVEELASLVDTVNSRLHILDENGNDMMLEKLDFRALPYYKLYDSIISSRREAT